MSLSYLKLKRKQGQSLIIDGDIEVKVTKTAPGFVRLLVITDRSKKILRGELLSAADSPDCSIIVERGYNDINGNK